MPDIDRATARVLDAAGVQSGRADAGCCGALRTHLADQAGGLADMRRNIDAWLPLVEAGEVEAIVSSASGLPSRSGIRHLAGDAEYAERAAPSVH